MRAEETFFRGYRRETMIDGAEILCNPAGEKRLKLSMKMPLVGDALVGMPTWVAEPYEDLAKPEFAFKSPISSTKELDPMRLHIFSLPAEDREDPDEKPPTGKLPEWRKELMTFESVRLCSFKVERNSDGDVSLTFSAYLGRTGKYLKFADDYFDSSLFIRYDAAQPSLLDENPNVQPTAPAPETKPNGAAALPPHDDHETERSAAADPALDPEFEVSKPKGAAKNPEPKHKPVGGGRLVRLQ